MMRIRHAAATHVGRVRKLNEDCLIALPDRSLWVVADGMGGHAAGDFASQTVIDCIATIPLGLEPGERMNALRTAILQAHALIQQESTARGGATIGATVVALMVSDAHFLAFWAGDSRLYRLRDGQIEMLTADHSIVGELVMAGQMTWDEADMHPQSNAITRAVGVGEELELGKTYGEVRPGDRYLLCSDGLTKYAGFETLRRMLRDHPIETLSGALIDLALAGGGADNISVIVVDTD